MTGRHGAIRASIPADPSYSRVVRLLTSNVAACAGLGFDRIEDAAMAANEAFCLLAEVPGVRTIACAAAGTDASIEMVLTAVPPSSDPEASWPDELTERVLRAVTEDVEFSQRDARIRFRIAAG